MNPKSAIQKGKELETYIAEQLRLLGIDARAQRQPGSGSGKQKGDIWNAAGFCFEAKNTKVLNFMDAFLQAKREAMQTQIPAVIWHPPRLPLSDSVAILRLADLLELIQYKEIHKSNGEILDKWQVKNNLERAIYHLKKIKADL